MGLVLGSFAALGCFIGSFVGLIVVKDKEDIQDWVKILLFGVMCFVGLCILILAILSLVATGRKNLIPWIAIVIVTGLTIAGGVVTFGRKGENETIPPIN